MNVSIEKQLLFNRYIHPSSIRRFAESPAASKSQIKAETKPEESSYRTIFNAIGEREVHRNFVNGWKKSAATGIV